MLKAIYKFRASFTNLEIGMTNALPLTRITPNLEHRTNQLAVVAALTLTIVCASVAAHCQAAIVTTCCCHCCPLLHCSCPPSHLIAGDANQQPWSTCCIVGDGEGCRLLSTLVQSLLFFTKI